MNPCFGPGTKATSGRLQVEFEIQTVDVIHDDNDKFRDAVAHLYNNQTPRPLGGKDLSQYLSQE